jgi:hypothetical protein
MGNRTHQGQVALALQFYCLQEIDMDPTITAVIKSQFFAALSMLKQSIERCPDELWTAATSTQPFWHIAYHALFYTHLYLQPSEQAFIPWERHQDEAQFLGPLPWPPHRLPHISKPYAKTDVLDYLAFCEQQVETRIDTLDLAGASGFDWLPFNKFELMLYTLRHLQQHTGELDERLGQQGLEVDWVGMGHRL